MANSHAVRAEVYWNLHKGMWSLRDAKTKRVVCHGPHVTLHNVEFRVQPAGRQRVRREGRKNIHAYAVGEIVSAERFWGASMLHEALPITYNPYVHDTFIIADGTARIVRSAEYVDFKSDRSVFATEPSSKTRKEIQQGGGL